MAFKMRNSGLPGLKREGIGANMADGKSPSSAFQMKNKRMKSNKPCPGCGTICPSCRGKKK